MLEQFIVICNNCSYRCAYDYEQLCYAIQHRTVLITFPLIHPTTVTAPTLSNGGDGTQYCDKYVNNTINAMQSSELGRYRPTCLFLSGA